MSTKQVRLHPDLIKMLDDFHTAVVDVLGQPIDRGVSTGLFAKGLKELGLPERIELVKVNDPKKKRSVFEIEVKP